MLAHKWTVITRWTFQDKKLNSKYIGYFADRFSQEGAYKHAMFSFEFVIQMEKLKY
jgi:hypothetical protein